MHESHLGSNSSDRDHDNGEDLSHRGIHTPDVSAIVSALAKEVDKSSVDESKKHHHCHLNDPFSFFASRKPWSEVENQVGAS